MDNYEKYVASQPHCLVKEVYSIIGPERYHRHMLSPTVMMDWAARIGLINYDEWHQWEVFRYNNPEWVREFIRNHI